MAKAKRLRTGLLRTEEKNAIAEMLATHTIDDICEKLNRSFRMVYKYAAVCLRERWLRAKTENYDFADLEYMTGCPDDMREQAEIEWNLWMNQFNGDVTATDAMMICDVIKIGFFEREFLAKLNTIQEKLKSAVGIEFVDLLEQRNKTQKEYMSYVDAKRKVFQNLKVTRQQRDANLKTNENIKDWIIHLRQQEYQKCLQERQATIEQQLNKQDKRLKRHHYE